MADFLELYEKDDVPIVFYECLHVRLEKPLRSVSLLLTLQKFIEQGIPLPCILLQEEAQISKLIYQLQQCLIELRKMPVPPIDFDGGAHS